MTEQEKLEEAKRLYTTANADQKYVLESLFPELKSKDERIRKVLIDYFNTYKNQEECGIKTFYGIPTDDILAWLEKQEVEQKSTNIRTTGYWNVQEVEHKPAWSEEDEEISKGILNYLCLHDACELEGFDSWYDWLKSSLKDKVQSLSHPKEWSEIDKDFMYDTLSNLTELKDRHGEGYGNVGKCIDWLRTIKERMGG